MTYSVRTEAGILFMKISDQVFSAILARNNGEFRPYVSGNKKTYAYHLKEDTVFTANYDSTVYLWAGTKFIPD
jgi:hypothetical protein